jgi:hypothetical protein
MRSARIAALNFHTKKTKSKKSSTAAALCLLPSAFWLVLHKGWKTQHLL